MLELSVYAICKNEMKYLPNFIDRLFQSLYEKDELIILDTGSTDGCWEYMQEYAKKEPRLKVFQKVFTPWRFDVARNHSKSLIRSDCKFALSLDIDEIFESLNWRNELEEYYFNKPNIDQIFFEFVYDYMDLPKEENIIPFEEYMKGTAYTLPKHIQKVGKFHNPTKYVWNYPIHEILVEIPGTKSDDNNIDVVVDKFVLKHLQVMKKDSRNSYFDLLELAVKENPTDDRMQFLYAREFMNKGKDYYKESIEQFKKYLLLTQKQALDEISEEFSGIKQDRAEACHFIAEMIQLLIPSKEEGYNQYLKWNLLALAENCMSREYWLHLGKCFGMGGRLKLARQCFSVAQEFSYETAFECDGLVWNQEYIDALLLSTVKPNIE